MTADPAIEAARKLVDEWLGTLHIDSGMKSSETVDLRRRTAAALAAAREAGAREERERCMADVCYGCRNKLPVALRILAGYTSERYMHEDGAGLCWCYAADIRARGEP